MTLFEWITWLTLLAAAFGGSLHCVGMCGGFVLAASASSKGWALLRGQLLYHVGKTMTYLSLGGAAVLLGAEVAGWGSWAAKALAVIAGLLLILAGWAQCGHSTGVWRWFGRWTSALDRRLDFAALGRSVVQSSSRLRGLYLGIVSGFLPCPLVWAFVARASAEADVLPALATMAVLGLGTLPLLLFVAFSGRLISVRWRTRLMRFGGVFLILLGLWTLYRGWTRPACCGPETEAVVLESGP